MGVHRDSIRDALFPVLTVLMEETPENPVEILLKA
jgi:hypothetical protein